MRRTLAVLLLAVVFVPLVHAGPEAAQAAKGGQPTGYSTIALDTGATLSSVVQPSLGDYVRFVTTYPKTIKNPRILVNCYQDGNLVFGMGGSVDEAFLLGGGGSIWLTNGGPANCEALLFYYGYHAGQQTFDVLASTTFDAGG